MRTCGLVTAGECCSSLNAGRHIDEKKDAGNRRSQGPGSAAVTLPDCNCGSVGSRRLRIQPRSDIQIIAEKGAGMGDKGGKKDKEKNKQQQLTKQKQEEQKKHDNAPAKKP